MALLFLFVVSASLVLVGDIVFLSSTPFDSINSAIFVETPISADPLSSHLACTSRPFCLLRCIRRISGLNCDGLR